MLTPEAIISATPDSPTAQSLLGRLALAHLTADTLMATNVFSERPGLLQASQRRKACRAGQASTTRQRSLRSPNATGARRPCWFAPREDEAAGPTRIRSPR